MPATLWAQEEHNINLQSALWSVIPFYFITLGSLLLFMWKLIRPSFPTRWIYLCTILGMIGAGVAVFQFKNIQDTQLPGVNDKIYQMPELPADIDVISEKQLDDYGQYLKEKREKEVNMQQFANFWVMAIPNIIVLAFAVYWSWRDRNGLPKSGEKPPRYV